MDWAYDEMAVESASPQQIKEALGIVHEMIAKFEGDGDPQVLESLKKVEAVLNNTDVSMAAVQSVTAHSLRSAK